MQKKYGFVYIWRDKKHNRYYIGKHWGTDFDGYICSSNWMRDAYNRRPQDFKRRILQTSIITKEELYNEEYKWLQQIKKEELGKKYYNLTNRKFGKYSGSFEGKHHSKESNKKNSESCKGRVPWNKGKKGIYSEEYLKKISESKKGNKYMLGKKHTEESKQKMSESLKGRESWNKGMTGIFSEETLQSMSSKRKGRVSNRKDVMLSEEIKNKISNSLKEYNKNKESQ